MPFSAETRTTVTQQINYFGVLPKLYIEYPSIFKPYTEVCLVHRPVNSPGAAGRLPVLTFFSQSPGIKIFSPGCLF